MQYRENPGNKDQLSILGYGCLRYSKKGTAIDQEKAEREMAAAVEAGVNYFDTAYTYGGSEACLGKFLAKGYRDKVKLPPSCHIIILRQKVIWSGILRNS